MADMDHNSHLNILTSLSSAMFDGDPGDEANHPARIQYGHPSSVSIGSPDFPPLPGANIPNIPPFLPIQANNMHVGEDYSTAGVSSPVAAPAAAAAAAVDPELGGIGRPRSNSEALRTKSSEILKEQWMSRYHQLIEYKRKHGHCNVPQREKQLGCWVSTQRTQYKLLFEGRQSQMNQERIDLLNKLDFDWDPRGIFKRIRTESSASGEDAVAPKGPDRNDRKWMQWYTELQRFKEQHGHCMVTRKVDNSLGIWVQKQRKLYRERQAGKVSKILTPEKIDLMNEIGFVWEVPPGSRPSAPCPKKPKTARSRSPKGAQDQWHQRLDDLKKYKEEHGDCFVPDNEKEYAGLYEWTSAQRQGRDKLSRDRKRKLDEIEFEWDSVTGDSGADDQYWNQKFFELSQFKVIHGHTNVVAWPSDPHACNLAEWCTQQRYNYQNLWADRYSPLSEQRIKQLNQLGFCWTWQIEPTPADADWSAKLELLKKYKVVNGHCNVPRDHETLGAWVDAQRLAMKTLLDGTSPPQAQMSWDRFSQLEGIGFEFSVRASMPPHSNKARAAASMQSQ